MSWANWNSPGFSYPVPSGWSKVLEWWLVGPRSSMVRQVDGWAGTAAAGWEQGRQTAAGATLLQSAWLDPIEQQQCLPGTQCHSMSPLASAPGLLTNWPGPGYRSLDCPNLPETYSHPMYRVHRVIQQLLKQCIPFWHAHVRNERVKRMVMIQRLES